MRVLRFPQNPIIMISPIIIVRTDSCVMLSYLQIPFIAIGDCLTPQERKLKAKKKREIRTANCSSLNVTSAKLTIEDNPESRV